MLPSTCWIIRVDEIIILIVLTEYEYFCAHAASLTTGCSPEVVDRLAVGKCGDSRAPSVADSGIGSSDTYSLYSECSQLSKVNCNFVLL